MDTNIFISSFWGKNAREIVELWKKRRLILCFSQGILKEYQTILNQYPPRKRLVKEILTILSSKEAMEEIIPSHIPKVIKEDPQDNKFLACALEGKIKYLISTDKHLLRLKEYKGVKIMTPVAFLGLFKGRNRELWKNSFSALSL